jgi:DNA-binding NtrC family response regulator
MRTVLVVDDEPSIRDFVRHVLSGTACSVVGFGDGDSALTHIGTGGPADLVISDYVLPGMDGLEFVRRFRELRPETPVLFLTGHGNIECYLKASHLGVARFIPKPVGARQLLTSVRETMASL